MTTRADLHRQDTTESYDDAKRVAYEDAEGKKVEHIDPVMQQAEVPKTFWSTLKYMFDWYPARMSPEEKRLVKKLDITVVGFGAVAFFLKYLDSSNINNAYVSGLKEELNIQKNEYAWFGFFYYIGYALFQVPSLLLVSRGNVARWFLPGVELVWGCITFCQIRVTNVQQIYAIRFFLGVLAIPSYTGVNYVLGSWYRGDELFKRSSVFMLGNSLGQMFSAYLQTGALGLDGKLGLTGWRWLFVIDGIITVPIALVGFVIFPGLPQGKRIWWMRQDELELAQQRMKSDGVAASRPLTFKIFADIFKSWHIWLCVCMITIFLMETYPAGQMTLWLKSIKLPDGTAKYSYSLINNIPTGIFAIIVVTTFLTGALAGIWNIWYMMLGIQAVNLFAVVCLRIWVIPDNLKWAAYFCLGCMGAPNPLFFGWINRLTKRNAEERAVIMGAVFCIGWAFFGFIPLVAYKTVDAPRWTTGYTLAICCCLVSTSIFLLGGYLHKREELDRARRGLADSDFDTPGSGSTSNAIDHDDARSIKKEEHEHVEYATNAEYQNTSPPDQDTRHFDQADRNREAKVLPNPVSV